MEASPQIRIGTAGWSYKDWEGVFYPPGMQRRREHPLEYLAQCFDLQFEIADRALAQNVAAIAEQLLRMPDQEMAVFDVFPGEHERSVIAL